MFYSFVKSLCKFWYGIIFRTRVIGKENLPKSGAFILAANHVSNWDPPFLGAFNERTIRFMGKEELFKNPIMSWISRHLHVFPVKRGSADRNAIKTALTLLKHGECLGIFPEGTRSKNGLIGKPELGVSLIAAMSHALVIPAAVVNTEKIFSRVEFFPKLAVIYGSPIKFSGSSKDKNNLEKFAQDIMDEILKLKLIYLNNSQTKTN